MCEQRGGWQGRRQGMSAAVSFALLDAQDAEMWNETRWDLEEKLGKELEVMKTSNEGLFYRAQTHWHFLVWWSCKKTILQTSNKRPQTTMLNTTILPIDFISSPQIDANNHKKEKNNNLFLLVMQNVLKYFSQSFQNDRKIVIRII